MNRLNAIPVKCEIHGNSFGDPITGICRHCTSHDPREQSGFTPGMEGFTDNRRAVEEQIARKEFERSNPLG